MGMNYILKAQEKKGGSWFVVGSASSEPLAIEGAKKLLETCTKVSSVKIYDWTGRMIRNGRYDRKKG